MPESTEPTEQPMRLPRLPRPTKPASERRKFRANSAADALDLVLRSAQHRGGLDALFLTDDFGLLVASSQTRLDLTELAAVAPIVARGRARATVRRAGTKVAVSVTPIRVLGEILHVAGLGGTMGNREREVMLTMAAARRILG